MHVIAIYNKLANSLLACPNLILKFFDINIFEVHSEMRVVELWLAESKWMCNQLGSSNHGGNWQFTLWNIIISKSSCKQSIFYLAQLFSIYIGPNLPKNNCCIDQRELIKPSNPFKDYVERGRIAGCMFPSVLSAELNSVTVAMAVVLS